jgi:hypothetical protein
MLNVFVFLLAITGTLLARGRTMLDGTRIPPSRDRAIVATIMLLVGTVIMLGQAVTLLRGCG